MALIILVLAYLTLAKSRNSSEQTFPTAMQVTMRSATQTVRNLSNTIILFPADRYLPWVHLN